MLQYMLLITLLLLMMMLLTLLSSLLTLSSTCFNLPSMFYFPSTTLSSSLYLSLTCKSKRLRLCWRCERRAATGFCRLPFEDDAVDERLFGKRGRSLTSTTPPKKKSRKKYSSAAPRKTLARLARS